MSIWDNMKKFAQPYSDDEFDDFDDYDDDYEDTEEEPAPKPRRSNSRGSQAPKNTRRAPERRSEPKEEPQVDEDDYDDDYDTTFNSVPKTPAAPAATPAASSSFSGKVMSMNRNSSQELVRYHPSSFADSKKAAKDLISSKAVILNLEDVDKDTSRRMVDFLSGVVFAMDGDVQKVAMSTYVFCPPNVFITGGPETVDAAVEETV